MHQFAQRAAEISLRRPGSSGASNRALKSARPAGVKSRNLIACYDGTNPRTSKCLQALDAVGSEVKNFNRTLQVGAPGRIQQY